MARPRKVEQVEDKSETWNEAFAAVTTALNKLISGDEADMVTRLPDIDGGAQEAYLRWSMDLSNNFPPEGKEYAVTYTASGRTIPMVRFSTRSAARQWIKDNVRPAAADLYDTALVDVIPEDDATESESESESKNGKA